MICDLEEDKNIMYLWSPIYYCTKLTPNGMDIFMWCYLTIKCWLWESQIPHLWGQQILANSLMFAYSLFGCNLTSLFHQKMAQFGRCVVFGVSRVTQAVVWRSGKSEAARMLWAFFQSQNHLPFSIFQDSLFLIIPSTFTSREVVNI